MKTATVGKIQKNFAVILKEIKSGEEIIITKRGEPVAKITPIGPKRDINWPDFYEETIVTQGKPLSEIVVEEREERF